MDTVEIIVLIGGVAAIAAVFWYFFGERESFAAAIDDSGRQEVKITVKGGYSPDVIVLKKGVPARLSFFRDETSACSEKVILSDFGIARDLPAHKTTSVEFTPDRSGEFPFTCGMNMLHGKLIVQ